MSQLLPNSQPSVCCAPPFVVVPVTLSTFLPRFTDVPTLKTIPTSGSQVALTAIVPGTGLSGPDTLSFVQLRGGATGDWLPDDYNATNNNVSWHQIL